MDVNVLVHQIIDLNEIKRMLSCISVVKGFSFTLGCRSRHRSRRESIAKKLGLRRIILCSSSLYCILWWVTALMERKWTWVHFEIFREQGECVGIIPAKYERGLASHLHFVTLSASKWILIVPLSAGPLCRSPKPKQF